MSLAPSDVKSRTGTAGPKSGRIPRKSKGYVNFGGNGPALGAAAVLMLMFMGATLPGPLYLIYRDELHFSQVTLTLIRCNVLGLPVRGINVGEGAIMRENC